MAGLGRQEPDAHLIAAARAAASWARARRAAWTDTPLPLPAPVVEPPRPAAVEAPPSVVAPPPVVERTPAFDEGPPPSRLLDLPVARDEGPSIAERFAEGARDAAPSIGKWLAVAAAVALLGAAAWFGAPYARQALSAVADRARSVETAAPASSTTAGAAKSGAAAGELRVNSTPPGARVLVDGKARGVTPLTLTDLKPGTHEVALVSDAGTVRRSVTIGAGEGADVDEEIFPGFVAVLAPFDVEISEGGRALQPDERGQVLLPPGAHDLQLANQSLNFVTVQHVDVKPGATTPLRVTPPASTLTVTSGAPAEVWLDGTKIGDTPLNAASVPLGTHEIVLKRAGGGERRFTVTIGTGPFTLNADADR